MAGRGSTPYGNPPGNGSLETLARQDAHNIAFPRSSRAVRMKRTYGDLGPIQQVAQQPTVDTKSILEQIAQQYYADAMQGASSIGQQMGQSFNRRGLGNSPLAAGLQSQAMNQALGRAQSEVAKMRLGYAQQQDALQRQDQMQSDQMLYKVLSMILGTAGSVAGTALFGPAGGLAGGALGGLLGPKPNLNYRQSDPGLTPLGNRWLDELYGDQPRLS